MSSWPSFWYCRKARLGFWEISDLFIPVIPLGYTFGRLGNFINTELYGRTTQKAIGMIFPNAPGAALRHPTQLYEAFFEGIFLFILLWSIRKMKLPVGGLFAIYLAGYGIVRFFIEFFREPDAHLGFVLMSLTMGQLLCAAMIAVAPCFFFIGPNMPDTRSKCRKFALAIQAIFEEGLHVSQDSQHFIFSTISISDIRELETLITDPSSCESDSLIELIYFPDESIQLRLEDRLQSERFQQKDEQTILEYLLSCRGKTLVRFDGLEPVLTITTPENGARAFLDRLNITRHLDPELIRVIGQTAGKQGRKYKVWLRNMVMELRERETNLLKESVPEDGCPARQIPRISLFFTAVSGRIPK